MNWIESKVVGNIPFWVAVESRCAQMRYLCSQCLTSRVNERDAKMSHLIIRELGTNIQGIQFSLPRTVQWCGALCWIFIEELCYLPAMYIVSWLNIITKPSCCFWKCDRISGCNFLYNTLLEIFGRLLYRYLFTWTVGSWWWSQWQKSCQLVTAAVFVMKVRFCDTMSMTLVQL